MKTLIPIDKVTDVIFEKIEGDDGYDIVIDKKKNLKVEVDIHFFSGAFNPFDKQIFNACLSFQRDGKEKVTAREIFHFIGGGYVLTETMKKTILESISKLAFTKIRFKFPNVKPYKQLVYEGCLMPCEIIKAEIGGVTVDGVINFLAPSPILKVMELSKQFITCDNSVFDVPKIRNSKNVLCIKSYVIERVLKIKGSHDPQRKKRVHKLQKIILVDTVFKICNLPAGDKSTRHDLKKLLEKIFNHLQKCGVISDWHFEKEGAKLYSVQIVF